MYACVLDAQQAGDRAQTIRAVQMVLDKYEYHTPAEVNFATMVRCAVRMLTSEMNDARDEKKKEELLANIIRHFEGGKQLKPFWLTERPTILFGVNGAHQIETQAHKIYQL